MAIGNPCFVLAGMIRTFRVEDGDGERGTADESLSLFIRHWHSVGWIKVVVRRCGGVFWVICMRQIPTPEYASRISKDKS